MRRSLVVVALAALGAHAEEGWKTHAVAISPDLTTTLRSRSHAASRAAVLKLEYGSTVSELQAEGRFRALAFRGDGQWIAAARDGGSIRRFHARTGRETATLAGGDRGIHSIAFAANLVAAGRDDNTVTVWDADTGKRLYAKTGLRVERVALTADARRLAAIDRDGRLHLFEAATGRQLRTLDTGDTRWGQLLAFSGDGKRVAGGNRRLRVFDVESGRTVCTVDLGTRRTTALALSRDGSLLAVAEAERDVRVLRIHDEGAREEHRWATTTRIGQLRFAGRQLAGAAWVGPPRIWELDDYTGLGTDCLLDVAVDGPPDLRVRLDKERRLYLEGRPTTLDKLSGLLKDEIRKDGRREKREGVELSRLLVEIDAPPGARWDHVGWILSVCMARQNHRVVIRAGTKSLSLMLPPNKSRHWRRLPRRIYVPVTLRAGSDGSLRYRYSNRETERLADVARYLGLEAGAARDLGESELVHGVLHPDNRGSFAATLEAVKAFRDAGIARLHLPIGLPSPAARGAAQLPLRE